MVVSKPKIFFRLLNNQHGQSELAILLAGMAILLGFAAYLPSLYDNTHRRLDHREVRQIFRMISNNIEAHVANTTAWVITESKDINSATADPVHANLKGLSCLGTGSGCLAQAGQTDGYIVLYDQTETPYVNPFWDSRNEGGPYTTDSMTDPNDLDKVTPGYKQGFTFTGEVCHQFNPDYDIGNDDCPIRATTRWVPVCLTAVCLEPLIRVWVEFDWSPSVRYKNRHINPQMYNFAIDRKITQSSITDFDCKEIYPKDANNDGIADAYDYTFTVPTGIDSILVKMWGAGGAGAGGIRIRDTDNGFGGGKDGGGVVPPGITYIVPAGGGGGGGSFAIGKVTVATGEVLGIHVGKGGAPLNASVAVNIQAGPGDQSKVIAPAKTIIALGGEGGYRCKYDILTQLCKPADGSGLGGDGGSGSSASYVVVDGKGGGAYNSIFNFHYDLEKSPVENHYRNDYFYVTYGGFGGNGAYGGGLGGTNNHQNDGSLPTSPGGGGAGLQGNFGQAGADGRVELCY